MNDSASRLRVSDFLGPRHWPTWLGLGLLRLAVLLPWSWQRAIGRTLGDLLRLTIGSRRRVAETNLRLCFPELDESTRAQLLRETFRDTGISLFEGGMSWWGSERRLRALHTIEGLEHLEAARALGRGVILLGGHYTTLEIGGRLLALHIEGFQPIYKPARNPLFDAVMVDSRQRIYDGLHISRDMRGILRGLKRDKVVWYAPDQDFGLERSVFAPFFGIPTATLTTTARLAKLSGAPLVPYASERHADGRFTIRLLPALEGFPSGDDITDASRVNAVLEEQIRPMPAQYLWVHKRFKTRPPGEPPVY